MSRRVWGAGSGAGTDNDFSTAANWTGDTAPANGDDVVFDATCVTNCTAGMDQSAVNLNSLLVTSGYTGTIGATGAPLQLDTDPVTDRVVMEGSGSLFITGGLALVTHLAGTLEVGGAIGTLNPFSGTCTVRASATVTTINQGAASASNAPTLTVPSTATVTTVNAFRGTGTCACALTALNVYGATWSQSEDVTTLIVTSGTVNWTDGDITTALMYGGTLDGSSGAAARAIATLERHDTSKVKLNNGAFNITVTADRYFGGSEVLDPGREYALA